MSQNNGRQPDQCLVDANHRWVGAAAVPAISSDAATLAEIRRVCPKADEKFLIQALESAWSVEEAQGQYIAAIERELDKINAEIASRRAALEGTAEDDDEDEDDEADDHRDRRPPRKNR